VLSPCARLRQFSVFVPTIATAAAALSIKLGPFSFSRLNATVVGAEAAGGAAYTLEVSGVFGLELFGSLAPGLELQTTYALTAPADTGHLRMAIAFPVLGSGLAAPFSMELSYVFYGVDHPLNAGAGFLTLTASSRIPVAFSDPLATGLYDVGGTAGRTVDATSPWNNVPSGAGGFAFRVWCPKVLYPLASQRQLVIDSSVFGVEVSFIFMFFRFVWFVCRSLCVSIVH
jgi:hypothetical protein